MEEERRLCYVGMTRAKETLILCSASVRTCMAVLNTIRESQFLRELDKRLLDGDAVYVRKTRDSGLGVSTGSFDGFAAKRVRSLTTLCDMLRRRQKPTRLPAMRNLLSATKCATQNSARD